MGRRKKKKDKKEKKKEKVLQTHPALCKSDTGEEKERERERSTEEKASEARVGRAFGRRSIA